MSEYKEYCWIVQWDKDGKEPTVKLSFPPSEIEKAKEYESRGYTVFMTYTKVNENAKV